MEDFIPLENSSISSGADPFTRPRGQFSSPRSSPGMNSPQHSSEFIPLGCSSPVFRSRGGSTPNWNNKRGQNRSRSNYNPYANKNNSPHFYRNRYSPHSFQGRRGTDNHGQNCDITKYYHPSMLEDPWLQLETDQSKNNSSSNNSVHNDSAVPSLMTNSSEEESDSKESFTCSGFYS